MGNRVRCRSFSTRGGFALAEVIVALFFVTMAIALVAGLGQQVMNLSKRSSQTGAVLELRNMTNAITRNTDDWLTAMRSSTHTQGLFAGCIPDPKSNISTFSCPATNTAYLSDEDLKEISENGTYHISSAPLVNSSGDLVAGTDAAPVFYSSEGRLCAENITSKCPLKSTGYFLRSNASTSQDPGSIKFVIKVERNSANTATSTTPMKAQYITMDIGDDWKDASASFSGSCPANTIKVGYLSNGKPSCINPAKPCADSNQMPIGLASDGSTLCKALPDCTANGGHVVLNNAGNDLICSSASPCGENKLFLGYFAGSGEPMCSSSTMKCAAGQVQTGISISGGNMAAECEALPTCADANQRLSFNGTKFVCESAAVAISCSGDKVMTGINADGSPNCIDRAPASDPNPPTVVTPTCGADAFYDSGWVDLQGNGGWVDKKFDHNLGTTDTSVYMELKGGNPYSVGNGSNPQLTPGLAHNYTSGMTQFWYNKTETSVWAHVYTGYAAKFARVHVTKNGCGGGGTASNTKKWESPDIDIEQTLTNNYVTVNHNLGATPDIVKWVFVCRQSSCKAADTAASSRMFKYGDEIPIYDTYNSTAIFATNQSSSAVTLIYFGSDSRGAIYYNEERHTLNLGKGDKQTPNWKLKAKAFIIQ